MVFSVRTDMAAEAQRLWQNSTDKTSRLSGVAAREDTLFGFPFSSVEILDIDGSKALGKPIGRYYTLELERFFPRGDERFPNAARAIAEMIRRSVDMRTFQSVLIAALGNEEITPDALGPQTARYILITRHLKEQGNDLFSTLRSTALCRPGVLGTSGIESAAQIQSLCERLRPDCVIAIDALAGCDVSRLCRTVQVSGSGIAPGSGVGNDRASLNRESLGVPVIAIGVPTVIDAAFFSDDERLKGLFVTPRSIHETVHCAGKLIAYGINLALHDGLTVADVDTLVG